jgi:hypothetical protein
MPIKADRSDLPSAPRQDGKPPRRSPIILDDIVHNWFEKYQAAGKVDYAKAIPELPYRASWASKRCDRSLFYALTDTPPGQPTRSE